MPGKVNRPGSQPSISVGLFCLVLGSALIAYGRTFWGWLLLAVSTFELVAGILRNRIGDNKARSFGIAAVLAISALGLYTGVVAKTQLPWVLASVLPVIVGLVILSIYGFISAIRNQRLRVFLKSLVPILFAVALIPIYHFYAHDLFPIDAILMLLAARWLQQGLYELFASTEPGSPENASLFFLSHLIVLSLILFGLYQYRRILFYHIFILQFSFIAFSFFTEFFIPEIAANERRKIDAEHPRQKHVPSGSVFGYLTTTHYGINALILAIYIGYSYFSLDEAIIRSSLQGDVFQASIGIVGIISGFSTLILSQRSNIGDADRDRRTYLLRGLIGIILLFLVIALFAFLSGSLRSVVEKGLPTADEMIMGFIVNPSMRQRILALAVNEMTFFSIIAALIYFFSLGRDLIIQFEHGD